MSADILTDGFRLLARISVAEIESRIEWLENALASYKTMLVVKQIMARKPGGFETPPEWEAFDEPTTAEQATIVPMTETRESIRRVLLESPRGLRATDISRQLGVPHSTVAKELERQCGVLYRKNGFIWTYCGEDAVKREDSQCD